MTSMAYLIAWLCVHAAAASPAPNVTQLVENGRRLLEITADSSAWVFPQFATLAIGAGEGSYTEIALSAMTQHLGLEIETTSGFTFGPDHDDAKVKVVDAGTSRENCSSTASDVAMSTVLDTDGNVVPSAMALGVPLALNNDGQHFLSAPSARIKFMHGGLYQLCYAPDGTFEATDTALKNAVFHTVVKVIGVRSDCNTQNCLEREAWNCHFNYKAPASAECEIALAGGSDARPGWSITHATDGASRISWTSAWAADSLDASGQFQGETPEECTETDPESSRLEPAGAGDDFGVDIASSEASMPAVTSTTSEGFTVTLCYCPNTRGVGSGLCEFRTDYVQSFGRLYYWTIRVCDEMGLDPECAVQYGQVIPQQPFRIRVLCPPGQACASGSTASRLRLRDPSSEMERQNWDPLQGCRVAASGPGSSSLLWSSNAATVSGGSRQDYKDFEGSAPMRLRLPAGEGLEVCYCDGSCDEGSNWLHVGRVQAVQAFALASNTGEDASGLPYLKYAGKPGGVALVGGVTSEGVKLDPFDGQRFVGDANSAIMNILSFDRLPLRDNGTDPIATAYGFAGAVDNEEFQLVMRAACRSEVHQADFAVGFATASEASGYAATARDDRRLLPFDGPDHDQEIVVAKAGLAAICYCGAVAATGGSWQCDDPEESWIFAGLVLLRGPRGDQVWTIAVGNIFGIDLMGWGFEGTDSVRILGAGQECTDGGSFDPASEYTSLYLECPSIDGSACSAAPERHDIALSTVDSMSGDSPLYITLVNVGAESTALTFSESIASVLSEGDVISLGLSTIRVGGRAEASWTRTDVYNAHRLAGYREFVDADEAPRLLGHVVHRVPEVDNEVTIPVGWSSDPAFTFSSLQGTWARHNKASAATSLQAAAAADGLVVCWAASDPTASYYSAAGTLNVVEPPSMSFAKMSFTTKEQGAIAPAVLAFGTSPITSEYASAGDLETMVRIKLLDASPDSGKLGLASAASFGGSLTADLFDEDEEVPEGGMAQSVCGSLFVELWTNDDAGFPMPRGCYYGRTYRYLDTAADTRELVVIFPKGNGLKHRCKVQGAEADCEYQLVINSQVGTVVQDDRLVDIDTSCRDCPSRHTVWERGQALASLTSAAKAGANEPQLGRVEVLGADSESIWSWMDDSNVKKDIQLLLVGSSVADQEVLAGAKLRLFLWPLTAWEMADESEMSCSALCIPDDVDCGGPGVSCEVSSVANTTSSLLHGNTFLMTLPEDMEPLAVDVSQTLKLSLNALPRSGWFPARFGVQLTNGDDELPAYYMSTQLTVKRAHADLGSGVARLMASGRTGYGPKPYVGDQENAIFVWLSLSATLRTLRSQNKAEVRIALPPGYRCSTLIGVGGSEGALPGEALSWEASGLQSAASEPAAVRTDADGDGYMEQPASLLSVETADGAWSPIASSGSTPSYCKFSLAEGMTLYRGSAVYTQVLVSNPSIATSIFDSDNVWTLDISSEGFTPQSLSEAMDASAFTPLIDDERPAWDQPWAANFAVLGTVTSAAQSAQPGNLAAGVAHHLSLFFTPVTVLGENGFLVIDAPEGYDFGNDCLANDLGDAYYVDLQDGEKATHRLDRIVSCESSRWPVHGVSLNRARIHVSKGLLAGICYGFTLRVQNPQAPIAGAETWQMWTQSYEGSGIEGTAQAPRFNVASQSGWRLYRQDLPQFSAIFNGDAVRPTSLSGSLEYIRLIGLSVPTSGQHALRVMAPFGFQFAKNTIDGEAHFLSLGSASGVGITAEFPRQPGSGGHPNELIWESALYNEEESYGFDILTTIPDHLYTRARNVFSVEFGYTAAGFDSRASAGSVTLPPLMRSVTNCSVVHFTMAVGHPQNALLLTFRIATTVPLGGSLLVAVDTRGLALRCPSKLEGPDGPPLLPVGTRCFADTLGEAGARLAFVAEAGEVVPGLYQLEVMAENPSGAAAAGTWTFASFASNLRTTVPTSSAATAIAASGAVAAYAGAAPIDAAMRVLGFRVEPAMPEAGLVGHGDSVGRIDRPLERNGLSFVFRLRSSYFSESNLHIRGPPGFIFNDFCLDDVSTDAAELFEESIGVAAWPSAAEVGSCRGFGSTAHLVLPDGGLAAGLLYGLRIFAASNPERTPERNFWNLQFEHEPSEPIAGFTLWTFTDFAVHPAVAAGAPSASALAAGAALHVTLEFRAYNTIPAPGGVLLLEAPASLAFAPTDGGETEGTACDEVELLVEAASPPARWDPDEVGCSATASRIVLELLSMRGIAKDTAHSLSVRTIFPFVDTDAVALAGPWRLTSFTSGDLAPASALDDVRMDGFPLVRGLPTFEVSNAGGELRGGAETVAEIRVGEEGGGFVDGDTLLIRAPEGFLPQCDNVAWLDPTTLDESASLVRCLCGSALGEAIATLQGADEVAAADRGAQEPEGQCAMLWTATSGGLASLRLSVAGSNSRSWPRRERAYWTAQRWRGGEVLSAAAQDSWRIEPQLMVLSLLVVGDRRSAGSLASIRFEFMPAYDAGAISLRAVEPSGFDFSCATVAAPHLVLSAHNCTAIEDAPEVEAEVEDQNDSGNASETAEAEASRRRRRLSEEDPSQIALAAEVQAGVLHIVTLEKVLLSPVGGDGVFHIRTYSAPSMLYWREEVKDQHARLPGKLGIVGKELIGRFQGAGSEASYPVRSELPALIDEWAWIELTFNLSQPVQVGHTLTIESAGSAPYSLDAEGLEIFRLGSSSSSLAASPGQPSSPHQVVAEAEEVLEAGALFMVRFAARPSALGTSRWVAETSDGGADVVPTNTNDADDALFDLRLPLLVSVTVPRAPPAASVVVTVAVSLPMIPERLELVAPLGFAFKEGVGACGQIDEVKCSAAGGRQGRAVAELVAVEGSALLQQESFSVHIVLPEVEVDGSPWILLAHDEDSLLQSWGSDDGFPLHPLADVAVHYAAIAGREEVPTIATFSIETAASGTRILLRSPEGYGLTCPKAPDTARYHVLPSPSDNCSDSAQGVVRQEEGELLIELGSGELELGGYAVDFLTSVPEALPQGVNAAASTWSIVVSDAEGAIRHSAFRIPAQELKRVDVGQPAFSWTSSIADQRSQVTFALRFNEEMEGVRSLLFVLPPRFVHDCRRQQDFRRLDRGFPSSSAGVDLSAPSSLRLDLPEGAAIPAGTYRFQFRIMLPTALPAHNLWYVALCSDSDACAGPQDDGVSLAWALPGFEFGERSALSLDTVVDAAPRRAGVPAAAASALLLMLLSLTMRPRAQDAR